MSTMIAIGRETSRDLWGSGWDLDRDWDGNEDRVRGGEGNRVRDMDKDGVRGRDRDKEQGRGSKGQVQSDVGRDTSSI